MLELKREKEEELCIKKKAEMGTCPQEVQGK